MSHQPGYIVDKIVEITDDGEQGFFTGEEAKKFGDLGCADGQLLFEGTASYVKIEVLQGPVRFGFNGEGSGGGTVCETGYELEPGKIKGITHWSVSSAFGGANPENPASVKFLAVAE